MVITQIEGFSGMEIDLGNGFYELSNRGYSYQRCINWYPSISESSGTKSKARLIPTPGQDLAVSISPNSGTGGRGLYEASNGRVFGVWGDSLFEVFKNNTIIDRNSSLRFLNTKGSVSISDNGAQLIIIDRPRGYILDFQTNTFSQITDVDYPSNANQVVYKDEYFYLSVLDTQDIYQSALGDGSSWSALSVQQARSQPDNVVGITASNTDLIIFGTKTIEHWQNVGDDTFSFQRINGATLGVGCKSANSIAKMNNAHYFLGSNESGAGMIWRLESYQIEKVSTEAIETAILEAEDTSEAIGYTYQSRGHLFYVISFPSIDRTFVFDEKTGKWHERAFYNSTTSDFKVHKSSHQVYSFGKNYVSYENDNNLYILDDDILTDNGSTILRLMNPPRFNFENKKISLRKVKLEWEKGIGLTSGQGSDPHIMMRYSKDGGYSWSSRLNRKLGEKGKYYYELSWDRLGQGRDYVLELSVSDPVPVELYGLYIDFNVLRT